MQSFVLDPITAADLPATEFLFAAYPYKTAQRLTQRLDRERLNQFYAAGLAKAVAADAPHWLVRQKETPLALAGLIGDAWHSEVYGLSMAKLQPWLNTLDPAAGEMLLSAVDQEAARRGYRHLSVRLDGEDFPNLHLFQSRGWRLVDVSMKFSRPMPSTTSTGECAALAERYAIDLATPADADWIRELGSKAHGGTHYLNDPALPREKTVALFAHWLDRCLQRLAYRVYVLRERDGVDATARGVGFITYLRNSGFAQAVGRTPLILDFVLVDPEVRGGGIGPWLIQQTLERESTSGFDYCELRTSAHNLAAVLTYEKLGFRCCATDFVLHRLVN